MKLKLPEKFAVVVFVSLAASVNALACNDAVSLERDIKQGLTVDSDAGDPNDVPDGSPTPPPLADGGACAEYTKGTSALLRDIGPAGCMVATGPVGTGPLPMVEADESSATLEGNRLHLMCKSEGTTVMDATIDCYQGEEGSYLVPPGALMLAGQLSDRPCTLQVGARNNSVFGVILCPHGDDYATNIWSSTLPPWGLGAYNIPITQ
ncbi:hypothetical protein AKJ09_09796 [Labilithrix luteola]|uniref:Uncharacterized protein n=1 Tax=Labilithrix luteola TaxID=1391654 RepID=A0A0K1QBM4_9BACT|nr:hypothetical protein [Labilithrix luteola]AKV03133.1 hypothetical protein AKJ09_09796 [Labilithrix luteola]